MKGLKKMYYLLFGRLRKSFSAKMALYILVVTAITFYVSISVCVYFANKSVMAEVDSRTKAEMDKAIFYINSQLMNVETAVNNAALVAPVYTLNPDSGYTFCRKLLELNPTIYAATLMYAPHYFPEKGLYYAPSVQRRGEKTEALEIGGPENGFEYFDCDSSWIVTNRLDSAYWCEPYYDSYASNQLLVTYSIPLHDKNHQIYAIIAVDVELKWLNKLSEDVKPYPNSSTTIRTKNDFLLIHPDSNLIAKKVAAESEQKDHNLFTSDSSIQCTDWSISVSTPESDVIAGPKRMERDMWFFSLCAMFLMVCSCFFSVRKMIRPLEELSDAADSISQGDFHHPLPKIKRTDEIGKLKNDFQNMQNALTDYIERLRITTESRAAIESELKTAAKIQTSMLPKLFPPFPDVENLVIFGSLQPAKAVGGDLFDFFIKDNHLLFCVGDVSGKGIPASLFMAMTRTLFRMTGTHTNNPKDIAFALNNTLSDGNEENMFVTMFLGSLDLETGFLTFCNAGHNAPLLIGKETHFMDVKPNIPIGVFSGFPFENQEIQIERNESIFIYTDGVTEAENKEKRLYSDERLLKTMQHIRKDSCQSIVTDLLDDLHQHVDGAEQSDDITVLCIRLQESNV